MLGLRLSSKGFVVPFGVAATIFLVMPSRSGYQDLASLMAQQPSVSERWREHLINSPFGTIHAATFSFQRPIGTSSQDFLPAFVAGSDELQRIESRTRPAAQSNSAGQFQLASYTPADSEVTGSLGRAGRGLGQDRAGTDTSDSPIVNRSNKGDFLRPRSARKTDMQEWLRFGQPPSIATREAQDAIDAKPETGETAALREPLAAMDSPPGMSGEEPHAPARAQPVVSALEPFATQAAPQESPAPPPADQIASQTPPQSVSEEPHAPSQSVAAAMAPATSEDDLASSQRQPIPDAPSRNNSPNENKPVAVAASATATPAFPDDLSDRERTVALLFGGRTFGPRLGALEQWREGEQPVFAERNRGRPRSSEQALQGGTLDFGLSDGEPSNSGHSIVGKGEVTGDSQRPMSLADRLGLQGHARAKAERCLANAVYFESRGESMRGQIAVAQVVMNRVFSGYYPEDVCGVVYQNSHRHLACQFTFACDGISDMVKEPDAWIRATSIAKDVLDGQVWLPEVGKSTHYHAYWVHPWWTRTMTKINKIGVHTFYRPRKWGDGSDAPAWGSAASLAKFGASF